MQKKAITQFKTKGFVTIPEVFTPFELEYYRELLEEAINIRKQNDSRPLREKSLYEQSFIQCQNLWEDFEALRTLTFNQKIGELAANLLSVNSLRIWHDQALVKEAGARETDIHHDQPYWPIKEPKTITAWIPLCDINSSNGQLGFFPGSHKVKKEHFVDIFSGDIEEEGLFRLPQLEGKEPEYQNLKVGDISFHHGLTFHKAKANLSNSNRLVYTIIFFADGCSRGSEQFHFSVDRSDIKVGEKIDSDVTPISYPIDRLPDTPKKPINESFKFLKDLRVIPQR